MSKTCHNCNNVFDDNYNICPRCGMQYIASEEPVSSQPQQPYGQPVAPVYPAAPADRPMTVGQWVGTILLTTCLGTISFILLLVWGFSNTTPETKKNYCRAMLIVYAIGIALTIILLVIAFSLASASGVNIFEEITEALGDMNMYRA